MNALNSSNNHLPPHVRILFGPIVIGCVQRTAGSFVFWNYADPLTSFYSSCVRCSTRRCCLCTVQFKMNYYMCTLYTKLPSIIYNYYLFRCKICDQELLFEYGTVLDHVRGRHKISFPNYRDKHHGFSDRPPRPLDPPKR